MLPVLQPAQLGRELAACTILGAAVGVVRAFFPVRGRGAFVPDALLTGAVLFGVQSYAAALSSAGVLRWYMVLAAFAAGCLLLFAVYFPVLSGAPTTREYADALELFDSWYFS